MEFRVFPQPKPRFEEDDRVPTFGKRQSYEPRERRSSALRKAEVLALGASAAFLAFLVMDAL